MQTLLFGHWSDHVTDPFADFEFVMYAPEPELDTYACLFRQQWANNKYLWLVGTRKVEGEHYVLTDVKEFKHSENRAMLEFSGRTMSSAEALGRSDG